MRRVGIGCGGSGVGLGGQEGDEVVEEVKSVVSRGRHEEPRWLSFPVCTEHLQRPRRPFDKVFPRRLNISCCFVRPPIFMLHLPV